MNQNLKQMKQLKRMAIALVAVLILASCDTTTPGNPNTGVPKLIAIKADNTGNACNVWNLQSANPITTIGSIPAFINMKPSDFITSPAGLLGQTTMNWQASAYDNVNKKYAVSFAESIVIYDLTSATIPTPITYVLPAATATVSNKVYAMEYVGGTLYVVQNNEIKKFVGGIAVSFSTPVMIPVAGVNSDTLSNMTKNGTKIFFILKGRLFTFETASTTIALVPVSGWSADVDYNGLEYFAGKIYCAKRTSLTTSLDNLVSIDLAGTETNIPLTLPYFKDFSRVSSALDPVNRIYYLSTSNGFNTNTNTMTKVDLNTGSNTTSSILGYQFGLQYKD